MKSLHCNQIINVEIIEEEDNNKKNLYLLARLILDIYIYFFWFMLKLIPKNFFLREAVFFLEIKMN